MRTVIVCVVLIVGSLGSSVALADAELCDECMATCQIEADDVGECMEECSDSDVCSVGGSDDEAPEYEEPPSECDFAYDDCDAGCTGVRKPYDLCMQDCMSEAGCG